MLATWGLVLVFLIELGVVFVAMQADRIVALFVVEPPPVLVQTPLVQTPVVVSRPVYYPVNVSPPTRYVPADIGAYSRPDPIRAAPDGDGPKIPERRYGD